MITSGLLVYALFFILIFLGRFILDYLKERELCPCMAKVPFSLLVLLVIIYNYFYTEVSFDGIIWIPLMISLTIGNFFIGTISNKFEILENIGIGIIVAGFIYVIGSICFIYGIPNYATIILLLTTFGLYFLTSYYMLGLKIKEIWHEYLYMLIIFVALIFSIQGKIGMAAPAAIAILLYSELINQISRFRDDDKIVEYDSATLYLIAITIMAVPKFIF